jgi:hypothetical protein
MSQIRAQGSASELQELIALCAGAFGRSGDAAVSDSGTLWRCGRVNLRNLQWRDSSTRMAGIRACWLRLETGVRLLPVR